MYVRDELGVFPECAYSLLLSISFLLTHREAVTGYPAGHRLVSLYPLGYLGTSHAIHCVLVIREGWGSLYIYSSCETGDLEGS